MSTRAHTPGPWTAKVHTASQGRVEEVAIHSSAWKQMAIVYVQEEDDLLGDGEANARLMASAPELLAACEKIVAANRMANIDGREGFGLYHDAVELASAAVAKAKGKSRD